jgi:hypothetical protein
MLGSVIFVNSANALETEVDLRKPINLSNNASHSKYHSVIALKEHVYVAWMDGDDSVPVYDIFFKASHDYGRTFSSVKKLSNGDFNYPPHVVAFGSNVYVAWTNEAGGEASVHFRASNDNGNTFGARKNLGDSTSSYSPLDMAAYDNNVYVVFDRFGESETEKVIRASHDSGANFDAPLIYSSGPCGGTEPRVAAWKNHVYVTAQDPCEDHPDLIFRASHNNGTSFSKQIYLGDGAQQVKIVSKGKFVYVVWNENTQDVNFRVSKDFGRTFGSAISLEGDLDVSNPSPQIAIAGSSDVYVVWAANTFSGGSNLTASDSDDIKTHLFFVASHDNGQSFEPLERLDTDDDYSVNPRVSTSVDNVFVVWQNISAFWTPSGSEVLLKRSDDKGLTFGDTLVIDNDTGDSLGFVRPDVDAIGQRVFISWWNSNELDTPPDIMLQRGKVT